MSACGAAERRSQRAQVIDTVELDLYTARLAAARAYDPDFAFESALHRLGERCQIRVKIRIAHGRTAYRSAARAPRCSG